MPFADRSEAGRRLAERVRPFAITEPLVLALPRGGVPVGVELAQRLDADLDVLMVRKIGLPGRPEAGVGAIAEDGHIFYDDVVLAQMQLPRQALAEVVSVERDELERRRRGVVAGDDGAGAGGADDCRHAAGGVGQEDDARGPLADPGDAADEARAVAEVLTSR